MENKKRKYAQLIIKKGVNMQSGGKIRINSDIKTAEFARIIMEEAYALGALDVVISWSDEPSNRLHYLNAPDEIFDVFPSWKVTQAEYYLDNNYATIHIVSDDPYALEGVDMGKVVRFQKASMKPMEKVRDRSFSNELPWTIAGVPSMEWASIVFPDSEQPIDDLWEAIFKVCRVNETDPLAAWDTHIEELNIRLKVLNDYQFKTLHYTNQMGTDFYIDLPNNHIWSSAYEASQKGGMFIANIPSEEVYTTPHLATARGIVYSTMPLNYNGNLLKDIVLTFEDGKVITATASQGEEFLKKILAIDEGASRLGEVALIADNSPISNNGILFYETLYDENASCHLALGKGFKELVKGTEDLDKEACKQLGINDSLIHIDFMIGSPDLQITGITNDGKEVFVFKEGNWSL